MAAKILIADDEPGILLSLEFLMKKQGYHVLIARDGEEAFDLIRQEKPDLLLLDIMMPHVNGYELCAFVKNTPGFEQTKVVFLSAKGKEVDMQKGYGVGADLYLPKPFSTRELVEKVRILTTGQITAER